ncbi:serine/threonine protein kinase [Fusarium oxysporum f. sp. conglutinans race 2 54008]|uniref:Serine/threonine protein kinase n=1 Tax=Fusarium oxysporum f. sp. conglutinans race 2 54008 TaxID=1089457 RepID=X0HW00_FUSOX|nr:serine/threonine protein kinase [Fusarium oxysporum f. sp. conglutinans race 2 54008]KAI8397391.1 hypothetical protein FOFC_20663 [Fusarium oxysporum]
MSASSSPLPFTIAEDDTAQPENPGGAYNSMSRLEDSPIRSSIPSDLNCLISRLNELKLDPSSSISHSRVVAVANEDEGVIMRGDGKPVDFPSGGLSIEQAPDRPYFTIGSDNITISGYYSPGGDDIIIHRRETNEVELASYSSVMNEMTPLRSVKVPFSLHTGLWQISGSGRIQIYLYIFPKPYILHISSEPPKRPHLESGENAPYPRKKVRLMQPRHKKPVTQTPNRTKEATKTNAKTGTSNLELLRPSSSVRWCGLNTAFRIDTISTSQRGQRQKTRDCFKLSALELVFSQSSTTRVFTGQHAQHGLVSFKAVAYPTRDLIQQHAQRWCREVSAARKINHRFLTTVLNADARLLSLCLDGQPILLCQRDDQSYFTGSNHEGIQLCIQITSALVFLHSTIGKPHLSVNSSNIFKKGNLFSLSGFEIAEDTTGLKIRHEEMKWYAAPEHVFAEPAAPLEKRIPRDDSREDGKKDVFSLAVILAYAWKYIPLPETCGESMYSSRTQWLRSIESIRQASNCKVANPFMNILLKGLDPEPKTRSSSRGLLELALDSFKDSAGQILNVSVA